MNVCDIIAFENGTLSDHDTLNMFASGIKTGLVWQLQGCYGRTAENLIDMGHISKTGEILSKLW